MDLRNSNGFELRNSYFTLLLLYNRTEAFFETFHQKWKDASCGARFYKFENIDLCESRTKVHKKPSETLGADLILRLEMSIYCLLWNFN